MKARNIIQAGVCGFVTTVIADSTDNQNVVFQVESDCENIKKFSDTLIAIGPIDAYQEISAKRESVVLGTARSVLKGCCAACVVPCGVFKTMQVAAGLALPKDIHLEITKETE